MTNKMTKKDYFNELRNLDEVQERDDLLAFIDHELELLNKKSGAGKKPTKAQQANEALKDAIYDGMEADRAYTITEIIKEIAECAELSNQKVTHMLSQMKDEGRVERGEDKRKAVYTKIA